MTVVAKRKVGILFLYPISISVLVLLFFMYSGKAIIGVKTLILGGIIVLIYQMVQEIKNPIRQISINKQTKELYLHKDKITILASDVLEVNSKVWWTRDYHSSMLTIRTSTQTYTFEDIVWVEDAEFKINKFVDECNEIDE